MRFRALVLVLCSGGWDVITKRANMCRILHARWLFSRHVVIHVSWRTAKWKDFYGSSRAFRHRHCCYLLLHAAILLQRVFETSKLDFRFEERQLRVYIRSIYIRWRRQKINVKLSAWFIHLSLFIVYPAYAYIWIINMVSFAGRRGLFCVGFESLTIVRGWWVAFFASASQSRSE